MRSPLKTAALTGFTLACLCLQAAAQVKPQPAASSLKTDVKKEELAARLEKLIPQLMTDGGVPGLSVLLIHDNRVFWQRSFGVTNVETKQPVTADTIFEAASLSKPVFAYGVLKLADAGKLDLDTPLVKYLPGAYVESDERLNQITARMVLSHRTGFPNWRRGDKLKIFFTPGERFSYSGEGYVYLQKVVEHLTNQPLDAFMQKTVFGPLGMTSSSYVWQAAYESRKTYGHDPFGSITGRRKPTEANAAASLHTTPEDYAKFVEAVMTGAGLKKKTAREMLTPYVHVQEGCTDCVSNPANGPLSQKVSWGLGWGLQHTADGDSFWHWGDSNNDAQAYVVAFPKRKLAIMMFANSGNGHSIFPRIIEAAVGGQQPAISWLNYDLYDSPFIVFAKDVLVRGEAAVGEYRERRKAGAPALPEVKMNRLGYALLSKKMLDAAIEVFKLNVEAFPDSWNVYDSLGEAYALKGEKELAIKNYQKSIELNPKNENGVEALKKLQAQ
jgi:CubicO group peptidase (beta-lactamase class C family)